MVLSCERFLFMIAVLSMLCGMVLGIRCTVLSVLPATVVAGCTVAVLGHLHRIPLGATALSIIVLTVALQFGYFIGAILRSPPGPGEIANADKSGYLHERPARSS
jgi:hypothetical protein